MKCGGNMRVLKVVTGLTIRKNVVVEPIKCITFPRVHAKTNDNIYLDTSSKLKMLSSWCKASPWASIYHSYAMIITYLWITKSWLAMTDKWWWFDYYNLFGFQPAIFCAPFISAISEMWCPSFQYTVRFSTSEMHHFLIIMLHFHHHSPASASVFYRNQA